MRKLVLTATAAAAFVVPLPAFAQDAKAADESRPMSEMSERLSDPATQQQMAMMVRALSEILLDMPLAPMMEAMSEVAGEDAPAVDPDTTLRSMAPASDRVPEEIERNLPRAMEAMGKMADGLDKMTPAMRRMAERMKEALPQTR